MHFQKRIREILFETHPGNWERGISFAAPIYIFILVNLKFAEGNCLD